ncbi:MAG TPA: hypothetical protein VGH74_17070, partial [Planctomycetaceae bacterium]
AGFRAAGSSAQLASAGARGVFLRYGVRELVPAFLLSSEMHARCRKDLCRPLWSILVRHVLPRLSDAGVS